MSWSDEPKSEERWREWDWMVDNVSSTIQSLAEYFDENSHHGVLACADRLIVEVVVMHDAAGVQYGPADPVVDVAGDADLVARWKDAEPFLDEAEEDFGKGTREAGVAFKAIAGAARTFCDRAEQALCQVAHEVQESGDPSPTSMRRLADETQRLVEWTRIYGSSVLGLFRVTGSMPDAEFGGGTMEEMLQYERAEELVATLVGANPWQ